MSQIPADNSNESLIAQKMANRQSGLVKSGWNARAVVQEVDEATPLFPELTSTYEVSFPRPVQALTFS
jgi:hypothetical protein